MKSFWTALAAVLSFLMIATAADADIAPKVDERLLYRLVAEANGDQPSDFDCGGTLDAPFILCAGLSRPPAEGFFGYFDVNPWTGDVWSVWHCKWLSTPALRKSQAAIRKSFSAAEFKDYGRLHRLRPPCEFP